MAKEASIKGLKLLGITEHAKGIPGAIEQNTNAVMEAIKNPKIDIISHPDDGSCPLNYDIVVQAFKKYNTLLEINNNSINPINHRKNAHVDADVGRFNLAYEVLNEVDFPRELIINNSAIEFNF